MRIYSSDVLAGYTASDDRINYTNIESRGRDLDDLLANATVGREDWHGNDLEALHISELPERLYTLVERDMAEWLAQGESA